MLSSVPYGRSDELAQLSLLLERAEQGHGSLALVVGEPGIGKSRLLRELTEVARARDVRVAWGRAWEAGGAPAHWPWHQVFRALLRDRLYESLLPTRRAELHWRAGSAIPSAVIAAHHLLLGARSGDAAFAARDAARATLDQLAYEETEGLVQRAQAVIERRSGLACELTLLGVEKRRVPPVASSTAKAWPT